MPDIMIYETRYVTLTSQFEYVYDSTTQYFWLTVNDPKL